MALVNYTASWTDTTPGASYKVYDNAPTPAVVLATVPPGTFSAVVQLEDTQLHQCYVTAIAPGGESLASNPVTLAPARPPAPTNFQMTKN